jgi:type II secretory ATPase GspE/PulE/Tfp pilus assembly ATPase PilB-like protein
MDNVTIKLTNGEEKRGSLAHSLDPSDYGVAFCQTTESEPEILSLGDIAYIKFFDPPDELPVFDDCTQFEKITVIGGEHFHVRSRREDHFPLGFYGFPINQNCPFTQVFFTNHGVVGQFHEHPIGEMLRAEGLVDDEALDDALAEQKKLRQKRLGEILVEQTPLQTEAVEATLSRAQRNPRRYDHFKVGEILIEAGLVTSRQVEEALSSQTAGKRKRLGLILVEHGLITEDQLLSALAKKFGLQVVDLRQVKPDPAAVARVSREMITRMQILPLEFRNKRLVVATSNPTDSTVTQNLHFATNCPIELVVASASQIETKIKQLNVKPDKLIDEFLDGFDLSDVQLEEEQDPDKVTESDSKVINLVNKLLLEAHQTGISDIHFEPGMGPLPLKIRYRKDGICTNMHQVGAMYKAAVISRIKILAKLDIAERRRPQSGKILIKYGGERIEYRVEITPTIGGQEDAVLRVLTSARIFPIDQVGFSAANLEKMRTLLRKPYGMILCVGPTGSGKTTSLHSALSEINNPDRKIWTAEDPVEITQDGLRQVQIHSKIGFTFEEALRSFLRADPDVIMIGEMRDIPTAKTAIGAALTGHLVFSTLHTNSAPETIIRLIEMGIDPYNFADCMLGILAQRLTRTLCHHCKQAYHPKRSEYDELVEAYDPELFQKHNLPEYSKDLKLMRRNGCDACDGQGYSGRIAIHEMLVNSPRIKIAVKHTAPIAEIEKIAIEEGMTTLRMDGIQKVFLGLTDLDQINKVAL